MRHSIVMGGLNHKIANKSDGLDSEFSKPQINNKCPETQSCRLRARTENSNADAAMRPVLQTSRLKIFYVSRTVYAWAYHGARVLGLSRYQRAAIPVLGLPLARQAPLTR
jgi:hypothetical protein